MHLIGNYVFGVLVAEERVIFDSQFDPSKLDDVPDGEFVAIDGREIGGCLGSYYTPDTAILLDNLDPVWFAF